MRDSVKKAFWAAEISCFRTTSRGFASERCMRIWHKYYNSGSGVEYHRGDMEGGCSISGTFAVCEGL